MDVHEQRLAGAGRHPEREFVEILTRERLRLIRWLLPGVPVHEPGVQVGEQTGFASEVAIEVDLGEQQRQILEVLERNAATLWCISDRTPVAHDMFVVA